MSRNRIKILLVEDDPIFGSILKSYLEIHDMDVVLKVNGKLGLSAFLGEPFDLCLLDIMMPEMDGFTLAREIRKINQQIPFIFLTAKTLKGDIPEGFRCGADDYITKPFDSEVLLMKIQAIVKRHQGLKGAEDPQVYPLGRYTFHYPNRILQHPGNEIRLTPKEAELLKMLCHSGGDVLPRHDALLKIWGNDSYFNARSMDVFLARLRKYLKADPSIEIINVYMAMGFAWW